MNYKILISVIIIFCSSYINAQTVDEAIRYSQNTIGGTARSAAVGGAFGAVGADFGALSTNPAGLGLFRRSQFTITPLIYSNKSSSTYFGNSSDDERFKLGVSNLGYVSNFYSSRSGETGGLVNANFAIGFNQLKNFNNQRIIRGFNDENSATGYFPDFVDDIPNNVEQLEIKNTSGSMNEFLFGLGFNFYEKLSLGINLSIPFINFKDETFYIESDPNNNHEGFEEFRIDEYLNTTSYGFNAKIGAIYKINDNIRAGLAYHSPTKFEMHDDYNTDLAYTSSNVYNSSNYQNGIFDYELKTPAKWVASVALLSRKLGFVSMDYELVDYAKNKYRSDTDFDFGADLNQEIRNSYTRTSNLRIGGEFVKDIYRLRLGYALLGRPAKEKNDGFSAINIISCGAGFHIKRFFLDFAYNYTQDKYDYKLYGDSPDSRVTDSNNNFMLTLGFKR